MNRRIFSKITLYRVIFYIKPSMEVSILHCGQTRQVNYLLEIQLQVSKCTAHAPYVTPPYFSREGAPLSPSIVFSGVSS